MKLAGLVGSGVDAKMLILDGEVSVNGEVVTQRGKKLFENDIFMFQNEEYKICKG